MAERPNRNSYLSTDEDANASTTQNDAGALHRSASTTSTKVTDGAVLGRGGGTFKKKGSLKKRASLRRSNSKRSMRAGSMKSLRDPDEDLNSVFVTPIPTSGSPTDLLADRFQSWRKLLKDLITYFREIQTSYEQRSKSLLKVSNVLNNTNTPSVFLSQGGLDDATHTLRGFHKHSVVEANKAKDIQNDVIGQLSGLRNDLSQKIKEIKSLSGDFKNTVEREKEGTRKAVHALQDALSTAEMDPASAGGKNDPFIVKLSVDRQVEKQIEEENYLHRAYLNLEGSGRELESIVVGEIQKAYNAYAGILKREVDFATNAIEELRAGPIAMPKDHEWDSFVENDNSMVSPSLPLRNIENIQYPGKYNPATAEIRGGMLERKSKYLKSYTPGWYVLSPTHLHEFKSADHIHTQQPVMSLYLLDQKLGSRSQSDATSHKFSLKGRQTGGMHRGHSWVFRAESYDTMMAWYEDISNLTEKSGEERNAFVRRHARSVSAMSGASSDGMEEDEADAVPYSANQSMKGAEPTPPQRPEPGGRFPSNDLMGNRERALQAPPSQSSSTSGDSHHNHPVEASGALDPRKRHTTSSPHGHRRQDSPGLHPHEIKAPSVDDEDAALNDQRKSRDVYEEGSRQAPTSDDVRGKDWATNPEEVIVSGPKKAQVPIRTREAIAQNSAVRPSSSQFKPGDDILNKVQAPHVSRHDSTTLSELHVPGEWAKDSRG